MEKQLGREDTKIQ